MSEDRCPFCGGEGWTGEACPHCGRGPVEVSSPSRLPPGTLLQDRYRIGAVLGQGGFGITYLAWDRSLERKLAVKEYFPLGLVARDPRGPGVVPPAGEEGEAYQEGLERFLEEARTLARFDDVPGIVSVRDSFRAHGTAYMVMTYLEGRTLKAYLEDRGGRIPLEEALELLHPVMDALEEVHRVGWLHRDVSPDNVLVPRKGTVTLLDFGAARSALRRSSRSLSVILKPGYAPEEQYRSRGEQGPWSDVYGLAATLYRCLTGQPPPDALDRLHEDTLVAPSLLEVPLPPQTEAALLRGLAVRAQDRYPSVEAFRNALIQGERRTHPLPLRRSPKKRWVVLAVLAAGALTGAAMHLRPDSPSSRGEEGTLSGVPSPSPQPSQAFPSPAPSPSPPGDLLARAQARWSAGDEAGALAILEEAVRSSPRDPSPHRMLARIHLARRRFDAAAQEARRALDLAPRDAPALFLAAQAAEGQGRNEEAQSFLQELLSRDATYPGAQALWERLRQGTPGETGNPLP